MCSPTKLQVFANFWPKKCYKLLSPPVHSIFISARLFSVPQVENEVKRSQFCGCCWDPRIRNWWIKRRSKKRNFRQLFRNCTTAQKPLYTPMEFILIKKGMCLPHVSSIFKKISPKTFGPQCVVRYKILKRLTLMRIIWNNANLKNSLGQPSTSRGETAPPN